MSSASGPTSFKKAATSSVGMPTIVGTKASLYSAHLLTSLGVSSLDAMLMGGVPIGSVAVVAGDMCYGRSLLKCFCAEGVRHGHGLFCGGVERNSDRFVQSLPQVVTLSSVSAEKKESVSVEQKERDMQIAWRYSGIAKSTSAEAEGQFNMLVNMDSEMLEKCDVRTWTPKRDVIDSANDYQDLFRALRLAVAQSEAYTLSPGGHKNLIRVAVESVGSALWTATDDVDAKQLTAFLMALRSLARNSLCVIMLTLSETVASRAELLAKVLECCDFAFSVRAFDEETKSSGLFKEQHGFFEVLKTTSFGMLQPMAAHGKFLFRSTRTKMVIERIHLPPDFEEEKDTKKIQKKHQNIDF